MEVSPLASVVLSFVFVIGLLLLTLWFLKFKGLGGAPKASGELHVVQTLRLGTKHNLSVVKYGDRTLLLGVSGHQITLLDNQATADTAADKTDMSEQSSTSADQPQESFTAHLKNLIANR